MATSKLLKKKATYAQDIDRLEHQHTLDVADTPPTSYPRVVWRHDTSIKTSTLDIVGLAAAPSEYATLRALHVTSDADFWFNQLVNDYDRKKRAWEIEIYPVPGDYTTDDPCYSIPKLSGNKADSQILITSRTVLVEGTDFDYVRELGADDLTDTDEDGDVGSGDDSYFYDDEDDLGYDE